MAVDVLALIVSLAAAAAAYWAVREAKSARRQNIRIDARRDLEAAISASKSLVSKAPGLIERSKHVAAADSTRLSGAQQGIVNEINDIERRAAGLGESLKGLDQDLETLNFDALEDRASEIHRVKLEVERIMDEFSGIELGIEKRAALVDSRLGAPR